MDTAHYFKFLERLMVIISKHIGCLVTIPYLIVIYDYVFKNNTD